MVRAISICIWLFAMAGAIQATSCHNDGDDGGLLSGLFVRQFRHPVRIFQTHGLNDGAAKALSACVSGAPPDSVDDDDKDSLLDWLLDVGEDFLGDAAEAVFDWAVGKITVAIAGDVAEWIIGVFTDDDDGKDSGDDTCHEKAFSHHIRRNQDCDAPTVAVTTDSCLATTAVVPPPPPAITTTSLDLPPPPPPPPTPAVTSISLTSLTTTPIVTATAPPITLTAPADPPAPTGADGDDDGDEPPAPIITPTFYSTGAGPGATAAATAGITFRHRVKVKAGRHEQKGEETADPIVQKRPVIWKREASMMVSGAGHSISQSLVIGINFTSKILVVFMGLKIGFVLLG